MENKESGALIKESENVFTLWCSGRVCCEGMLVELKLIKVILLNNIIIHCDCFNVDVLEARFGSNNSRNDASNYGSNTR